MKPKSLSTGRSPNMVGGALPVFNHFFAFSKDKFAFFKSHCASSGNVFRFKLFGRVIHVINHPEGVKHVLADNMRNYSRKRTYAIFDEILGVGLITAEGDEWRKRRRLAQPAFKKANLDQLIHRVEATVDSYMDQFNGLENTTINVTSDMNRLALKMLCNSILQTDYNFPYQQIEDNMATAWRYIASKRYSAFKFTRKLPSKTKREGQAAIAYLRETIARIIAERKETNEQRSDLLGMYMTSVDEETQESLKEHELLDEVMTLFNAGHETTGVVLNWALYLLAKHPSIQQKVKDEIHTAEKNGGWTIDELRNFTYTTMVIKEAMRLYPPVWAFGRRAVQTDEICGYSIPANGSVTLPTLFLHRSAAYWSQPDAFYPEHFRPEAMKAQVKYSYFPFGGGQRLCIGEHFAMIEIQLVILKLLAQFTISLADQTEPELDLLITIKPKKDIRLNLTRDQ